MNTSWRSVLINTPNLQTFVNWPAIDLLAYPIATRKIIQKRQMMVSRVLNGDSIEVVAHDFSCSTAQVNRLLRRCLTASDSSFPLSNAFIPNTPLYSGVRRKALSTLNNESGSRGAFEMILDKYPPLRAELNLMIKKHVKKSRDSQNLTPQSVHGAFLRLLNEQNHPKDTYPFTHASLAYESVRLFFHERCKFYAIEQLPKSKVVEERKSAAKAFHVMEIDEQLTDLQSSVTVVLGEGSFDVRLARLTLMLAVDRKNDCYLGYVLVLRRQVSQDDFFRLMDSIYTPHQLAPLQTPGISYIEGAGFPSTASSDTTSVTHTLINIDNAYSHLSASVSDFVTTRLGSTLHLGFPRLPKSRNVIEYAFKRVSGQLQRNHSATGPRPKHRVSEPRNHQKKAPLVTLQALEDQIAALLANHNAQPQARLGLRTPLKAYQDDCTNCLHRTLPLVGAESLAPLVRQQLVRVKWQSNENRRPHINFYHVRYVGECLNKPQLIGKKIVVKFTITDIRKLQAYDCDGKYLGELSAPVSWQVFPHSITTRNEIVKLIKMKKIAGGDPFGQYFVSLLKDKEKPKQMLELCRIVKECKPFEGLTNAVAKQQETRSSSNESNIPDWSDLINT